MPHITTPDQLKSWLETQTQQVCTVMAVRSALRVYSSVFDLQASRAILTAAVSVAKPSPAIIAAVSALAASLPSETNRAAALSIRCAAHADMAPHYATRAATYVPFHEALFDVKAMQVSNPTALFASPLWAISADEPVPPLGSGFWADWYQGCLDGTPIDWDVQKQIALIPDRDWDEGAAHMARLVADITA